MISPDLSRILITAPRVYIYIYIRIYRRNRALCALAHRHAGVRLQFGAARLPTEKSNFRESTSRIIPSVSHDASRGKRGRVSLIGASITRIFGGKVMERQRRGGRRKNKSRLLARDYVGLRSDCLSRGGRRGRKRRKEGHSTEIQNLYIRRFTTSHGVVGHDGM